MEKKEAKGGSARSLSRKTVAAARTKAVRSSKRKRGRQRGGGGGDRFGSAALVASSGNENETHKKKGKWCGEHGDRGGGVKQPIPGLKGGTHG